MKPSALEAFVKKSFQDMSIEKKTLFIRWCLNEMFSPKKTVEIDTAAH